MQEQAYTLIVDFSIQGDLAYLSHQETLKMFERALIRASVPLMFTLGFNPHPRLSIPFPRSVGTQSQGDRICAMVAGADVFPVEDWASRIQNELPTGCTIVGVQIDLGKSVFYPQKTHYIFHIERPFNKQITEHLNSCFQQVCEKSSIEIQRYWAKKRRYKKFDISPCLEELYFTNQKVEVVCSISPSGTVRVDEIMQWLNIVPEQFSEPVIRKEINWSHN